MSNPFCRPKAAFPFTRAMHIAASLSGLYLLALPTAHAADTMAMPMNSTTSGDSVSADIFTSFSQYRKWQDDPIQDWAASNDRVGQIGGWMTYLRDTQSPEGGSDAGGHSHHGH